MASNGPETTLSESKFDGELKQPYFSLESPNRDCLRAGKFRLSGWCFHPDHEILELSVKIGQKNYVCKHNLERKDVSAHYPDFWGSLHSGFETDIELPAGCHVLQFEVLLDNGEVIKFTPEPPIDVRNQPFWYVCYKNCLSTIEFIGLTLSKLRAWRRSGGTSMHSIPSGFSLPKKEELYSSWLRYNQWNSRREDDLRAKLSKLDHTPLISVLMPVFNPEIRYLELAIKSLKRQVYENWELCIADDCSTNPAVGAFLKNVASSDPRIKLIFRKKNGNISMATNSAAELASGEFVAFLDQDDELTPDALGQVALYLADHPNCDFLYSDDDKINTHGERFAPQFKPDWSPELLLSYMYFGHLVVVCRNLFTRLGGCRAGFEGSQDYDFALRATEHARYIGHIPLILYHWRALPGSTALSGSAKPGSFNAGLNAVQEALERRGIRAKVYQPDYAKNGALGIYSLKFPDEGPSVTILIPTKNSFEILKNCIQSLELTTYQNFEIVIIDNESDDPETLRFLKECGHTVLKIASPPDGFNYSYLNNRAVDAVESEYVLFLNNDTQILSPTWLSEMMGYAQIKGVGAIGARLLYPDGKLQHSGIIHGYYKGMAGPAHKLLSSSKNGYLNYAFVSRNYLAVTAACLLMPRQLFTDLEGFNEADFGVAYNDVDLCYRIIDRGLRCVYSAGSELMHYEGKTRGHVDKPAEEAAFKLKNINRVDQYYNPNLSLESEQFKILARSSDLNYPEQPIRALMVAFNLNLEGAPYSQYELTLGLKLSKIVDPVVYCPQDGPLRELYEKAGIKVIISEHPLSGVFDIGNYEAAISKFAQLIRDLEVQIIYANTLETFYAIDAANLAGLPSIWNPRESEPWQTYFARFGDQIAARALDCFAYPYRVIFVSDATRHGCKELNSTNNFATIYNGLNLQLAANEKAAYTRESSRMILKVQDDEIMVLLLGTVCERKGQLDLINAIEHLMLSETIRKLRFFIVGDRKSAYSQRLHRRIDQLPEDVKERVSIVEETKERALYFSAADIFICSSRVESYPRVILEAMYYELAIVTTPVFGIAEQLTDQVSALFYSPGDTNRLAKHIQRLSIDSGLRKRLSINSGLRLKRLTSFNQMIGQYAECFMGAYYSDGANCDRKTRLKYKGN